MPSIGRANHRFRRKKGIGSDIQEVPTMIPCQRPSE
ncbi:hypothetical protein WG66_012828 [Moniliophthora roreri]|nr:hypothetical protein WG66_012828 [Moniliophthora roreri]